MSLLALDRMLRESTAQVVARGSSGAGVFVARGLLLTCNHVVGDTENVTIVWEPGDREIRRFSGKVTTRLADGPNPLGLTCGYPDVAVVQFDAADSCHPCVMLGAPSMTPGSACQAYGYPREGDATGRTPVFLRYRGQKLGTPTPFLDFGADRIREGMSGGPVLDLVSGHVVAILVASKSQAIPDGGLAVPWSELRERLPEVISANEEYHQSDRTWLIAATKDMQLPTMRHKHCVTGLDFDSNGNRLASSSLDRTAKLWDSRTGQELGSFSHPGVPGLRRPRIMSVSFSPDGACLATAGSKAILWSIRSGRELGGVDHEGGLGLVTRLGLPRRRPKWEYMTKLSYSPSGRFLATAAGESVRVWSLESGELWLKVKHRWWNPTASLNTVTPYTMAFSHDGRRLAVVQGPILTVWEVETREAVFKARLPSSLNWFTAVAMSKKGELVLTGGATVALWDGSSGELLTQMHADSTITSVACTPDADLAIVAESRGAVRVVKTDGWTEVTRWQQKPRPTRVAVDNLGQLGAIGSVDGTVRVINLLSIVSESEAGGDSGKKEIDA